MGNHALLEKQFVFNSSTSGRFSHSIPSNKEFIKEQGFDCFLAKPVSKICCTSSHKQHLLFL